ncbi:Uncharacterised protein [Mycobacteroides abscessus subsp. abscessus]|nr:Uncharacterised protein [Mycobacteroides abscessus subsp. abscessus]
MPTADRPPRISQPGERPGRSLTWYLATLLHQIAYAAGPLTKTTAAARSRAPVPLAGAPDHYPPWLTGLALHFSGQPTFYIRRGTQQLSENRLDPSSER